MGLPPVVTGVSPKEGPPGTRVTIRGENLGFGPEDITGIIYIYTLILYMEICILKYRYQFFFSF